MKTIVYFNDLETDKDILEKAITEKYSNMEFLYPQKEQDFLEMLEVEGDSIFFILINAEHLLKNVLNRKSYVFFVSKDRVERSKLSERVRVFQSIYAIYKFMRIPDLATWIEDTKKSVDKKVEVVGVNKGSQPIVAETTSNTDQLRNQDRTQRDANTPKIDRNNEVENKEDKIKKNRPNTSEKITNLNVSTEKGENNRQQEPQKVITEPKEVSKGDITSSIENEKVKEIPVQNSQNDIEGVVFDSKENVVEDKTDEDQPHEPDARETPVIHDRELDVEQEKFERKRQNNEAIVDDILMQRSMEIRKKAFSRSSFDRNKMIGIWSPLTRTGVTTFIMNYAAFLGQQKIEVAVIEGLGYRRVIKTLLQRITPSPDEWTSYAQALYDNNKLIADRVIWSYNNVSWYPLGDDDLTVEWSSELLFHYMNTVKYYDVVLCDLPSGEMADYTKDTLEYLDELWIMVDDTYHQNVAWKEYTHRITKDHNIKVYLLFNSKYEFSQDIRMSEEMGLPLLASLPPLDKEIKKNYYETKLLIHHKDIKELLLKPYLEIFKHITGQEVNVGKEENDTIISRLRSLWKTLKK